ncbi:MAG: hypothetical protein ACO1NY_08360 [Pseudorhodoplanes sp.]
MATIASYIEVGGEYWNSNVRDRYLYGPEELRRRIRNEFVSARMYTIDIAYTQYEAALTREMQAVDFGTDVATTGLNLAGTIVGGDTARILAAVASSVTGINNAYAAKILRAKLIENVQSAMRAARNQRAAVIIANMTCSSDLYTLGMALSDLEAYYRAGLFHSGLIRLSGVITTDEAVSAAKKDSEKPAQPATVVGTKEAAAVEATATGRSCYYLPERNGLSAARIANGTKNGTKPEVIQNGTKPANGSQPPNQNAQPKDQPRT